ncbi:MAG TPA: hypothetical protein VFV82_03415 [Candidatus Binatia bacterium]|nr:hypothetical protein [Candidatus Binatia bacterium]
MLPMAPAPRAGLPLAIGAELISAISRWLADPDPDQAADPLAVPVPLLTGDGKDSRGMLDVVEQARRTEAA